MPPKEGVSGSIPGRQSSGPKERYPGYGSLHYTQYGILLFLLQRGPCVLMAVVFGDLGLRPQIRSRHDLDSEFREVRIKNHPTVITDRTPDTRTQQVS